MRTGTSSRRSFLRQAGIASISALAGCVTSENKTRRPISDHANIVLLVSDEHNPRFASPYGDKNILTPNLERLAQRGTVFENAYCPSPLCMPSRSAFMAGRPVHALQTYSNCNAVQFDYPTYGAVLQAQGVHTAYIGKTDVFRPGMELGFSEMILPGDRTKPGDTLFRRTPLTIRRDAASRANAYGPATENPFAYDDQMIAAAVDWLRTKPKSLTQPWVLTVNIVKPHFPQWVTQSLWDQYPEGGDLPAYGMNEASAQHPYAQDLRAHFQTQVFTEDQIRGLRRGYRGCITAVDTQVGKLLDVLDAENLTQNTVFAYTSDHGEMLGKFGLWWKCSLYEDSARIPLIVAGPGFHAASRVQTPVEQHDLQATLFQATHTRRPHGWRGNALQSMPLNDPDRIAFVEYHGHGTRSGGYAIRKGDWKLIYCMAAPHQLFNLTEDPEECTNLLTKAPEKFRELERELRNVCSPEAENLRAHAFERRLVEKLAL